MKKVLFRFEAGVKVGMGHAMRCLALIEIFQKNGICCVISTSRMSLNTLSKYIDYPIEVIDTNLQEIKEKYDLLIVDSYQFSYFEEKYARIFSKSIMVIEDLPNRIHDCDILLDQTYGRNILAYNDLVNKDTYILIGSEFTLLRPQFNKARLERQRIDKKDKIHRVFFSLGGSEHMEITKLVFSIISKITPSVTVDYVITDDNENLREIKTFYENLNLSVNIHVDVIEMADLMSKSDIAIGASGVSAWERCCLGIPTLTFALADNQQHIAKHLHDCGAVISIGLISKFTCTDLENNYKLLIYNKQLRKEMSEKSMRVSDGLGAARVTKIILEEVLAR